MDDANPSYAQPPPKSRGNINIGPKQFINFGLKIHYNT